MYQILTNKYICKYQLFCCLYCFIKCHFLKEIAQMTPEAAPGSSRTIMTSIKSF